MATRITYHQVTMAPYTADPEVDESFVIPHVESGWCQVVNAEFVGGGSDKRFLLHVVAFEPVPEPEEEKEE